MRRREFMTTGLAAGVAALTTSTANTFAAKTAVSPRGGKHMFKHQYAPHGLIMVIEPLNPYRDHPGMFLSKIPQAYMICTAVGSPACKILFDIYHQQITEGNLIPNMNQAWEEIAYFQIGDNPGRKEPTTGEINYRNVFKHIYDKGYRGVMGMEHGNSKPGKEGELAVIEAYVACDVF